MRRETPAEWQALMRARGISSLRMLAVKAGVSSPAATRLVHGDTSSSDETIAAVAEALGVPLARIYELVGVSAAEAKPYSPPAEASRLTDRQRRAIDEIIRSIVAATEEERGGNVSTAPITRAGESPAESKDDTAQDDVDLAAYDTGRESQGRRLRRLQDEAAEAAQD